MERLLAHPEDRVDDTVEVLSKVLRQKEDALTGLQDEFGKVPGEPERPWGRPGTAPSVDRIEHMML